MKLMNLTKNIEHDFFFYQNIEHDLRKRNLKEVVKPKKGKIKR